jgi:hypothetical protein
MKEAIRDNEKRHKIGETRKLTFHPDQHETIKELKPMMRHMV